MPRACTICAHPERHAIDQALAESTPNRRIAAQYVGVTENALRRHKAKHLPVVVAKAVEAADIMRAGSLLDQLRALQTRAIGILDQAERSSELPAAIASIREVRSIIELLAKMEWHRAEQQRRDAPTPLESLQFAEAQELAARLKLLTDNELDVYERACLKVGSARALVRARTTDAAFHDLVRLDPELLKTLTLDELRVLRGAVAKIERIPENVCGDGAMPGHAVHENEQARDGEVQ